MRITFTAKGTKWSSPIDARFGRAEYLLTYDTETEKLDVFDNSDIKNEAHGAGNKTAQKLFELNADVLITGNGPGGNAGKVLEKMNLDIFIGAGEMTVQEAYKSYNDNKLSKF